MKSLQTADVLRPTQRPRYRVLGGKPSIELKLRSPRQLFDERDPAPFRERDLDDDAVRYIVSSFRDLSDHREVKLSLYFESLDELKDSPQILRRAIHDFFRFEADLKGRELKQLLRTGLMALMIGLTFLFSCTAFSHSLENSDATLPVKMLKEGLFIMGWVSMWKPISIFLYEWWPIRASRVAYKRLSEIEVEILPLSPLTRTSDETETKTSNPQRSLSWNGTSFV